MTKFFCNMLWRQQKLIITNSCIIFSPVPQGPINFLASCSFYCISPFCCHCYFERCLSLLKWCSWPLPWSMIKLAKNPLTILECSWCNWGIPRCALLLSMESPWRPVYNSRSDQGLITLTELDFATLEFVTSNLKNFFDKYSLYSKDVTIVALKVEKMHWLS